MRDSARFHPPHKEISMRPSTVFLAGGILGLTFGLSFLLVPATVLPLYGVSPDPATVLISRFFGVALFHLGLLLYLTREIAQGSVQRAMALEGVAGSVAGAVVALMAVLGGLVNGLGWSTVAIYGIFLVGYAGCVRAPTATP
jgi:hypothetical protein